MSEYDAGCLPLFTLQSLNTAMEIHGCFSFGYGLQTVDLGYLCQFSMRFAII